MNLDNLQTIKTLDDTYVLHTYARSEVAFIRGQNATLYDTQGQDYIDFGAGIAVCSVGHANPRLAETIAKQAQNLLHTSNLYYIEPQARLAQKLIDLYRQDSDFTDPMRAFFCNSGAEANECAIKIARLFGEKEGRYKIITLESSFHGRTIASLKATGQDKMHQHFGPYPDGFVRAKDIDDIIHCIDSRTCGVLIELIQGEGGISPMDKEKVQKLASDLKSRNILLMIDEVQSGIYRSGEIFASKLYGINPDIISTAKGLAGGVPIGAVITTLTDIFQAGDHGSTFGGNFLSAAAGVETLEILQEIHESGTLAHTIESFHQGLNHLLQTFPHLFNHKVGIGLMCGLSAKNETLQKNIIATALKHRVLVLKSGKGVVRFLPALTISQEEMKEGFLRLHNALKTIQP